MNRSFGTNSSRKVVPEQNASKTTHIERTSSQFRQRVCAVSFSFDFIQGFFLTRIVGAREATRSVRLIDLEVLKGRAETLEGLPNCTTEDPRLFTFKPGQWLDTYVPFLAKPGGFSLISTPREFTTKGTISLAIQNTDNPPSKFLWCKDVVGQYVIIRVGGDFTFPPSLAPCNLEEIEYLQFIAGGVGIKYNTRDDS
jgi:hypothetical protein